MTSALPVGLKIVQKDGTCQDARTARLVSAICALMFLIMLPPLRTEVMTAMDVPGAATTGTMRTMLLVLNVFRVTVKLENTVLGVGGTVHAALARGAPTFQLMPLHYHGVD